MKALIITNSSNEKINPSLTNMFGTVKNLGGQNSTCDVLLVGHNLSVISQKIAAYARVNKILLLDDANLKNILVENIALQLSNICKNYTHILINADSFGKNLLPRIGGILDIGQISEVVKVISPNIFKRFIYAGNVLLEVESLEDIKLLTIRANCFPHDSETKTTLAPIEQLAYTNSISDKIKFVTSAIVDKSVSLNSAKIVVSGGIALGSKEDFDQYIRPFANKLGAAVGATRAAVEAGYAPNDCQVGQTGTVVAPLLYLACGISGAVQHIAGMKDSQTVIAINTDTTAAIFEYADYGIIGDLFTIIPQLISKL